MKKFFDRYSPYFILLLAAALRLFHLDRRDFWYDEAFTGIALKESFSGMMNMIIQDVHPPLYYTSAKIFSSLFNYSVFGIRLYSVIFGILGIWAVYLFTKELFDRKAALWASLITAISPFAIQYSQEARMYSMFGFLIVIASYFFIKGLKTEKIKYFILWGMFLGLSFLTHYVGIIFAAVFYGTYFIWNVLSNEQLRNRFSLSRLLKYLIPRAKLLFGYVVSFLIFAPWLSKFVGHLEKGNLDWIMPAKLSDIFANIHIFLFGIPLGKYINMPSPNQLFWISESTMLSLTTIFIVLVAIYLVKTERFRASIILFLAIGFLLVIYILSVVAGKHFMVARYLVPSAYFVFILIGAWISKIQLPRAVSIAVVYVVLLVSINPFDYPTGHNEFYKNLEKYDGKNFYALNSFDFVITKYYVGKDRLTLYNIDWPQYDSSIWAAIGEGHRGTENYDDLKNDENGIIIHNTEFPLEERSDKSFNPENFELVAEYDNIALYKSSSFKEVK